MPDRALTFGRYRFDPRGGLTSGAREIKLTPKALALLSYLTQRPGEVVTKDELFAAVWPETTVGDAALVTCVQELRGALKDDARAPRYIETLHRRGYRFIGKPSAKHQNNGKAPPLALPDKPSIAVLPFVNMSGDADQEYFADGISEDLITELARIRWLFVIARNSSFIYKNRAVDVKEVSRSLGVRYVLEGSVRRSAEQVRVTAQLVDATTGVHHWAEHYDREPSDIFAIQDQITRSVAGAIEPSLMAAEGVRALSRSPDHLDAWELVARAKMQFWRMSRADYEAAVGLLTRAVETHGDYAPARSFLGFCLTFAVHMGWIARGEGLETGRVHAVRAIALDDRDPFGHIALGYCALMERRAEESIAAFRRAVALNPSSAAAHSQLSRGFAFAGRDREAIEHGEEAIRLSPLDPEMALFLGAIAVAHFTAGRYDETIRLSIEAQRLRRGFQGSRRLLVAALAKAGRLSEARSLLAVVQSEQPQLSIAWIRENVPYQTPELMDDFLDGMRKAGLEE